jgi:hypothetical protein
MNDFWIQFAKQNKYKYICVMKDLEDNDIYPLYFKDDSSMQKHKDNIISESKIKIIKIIEIKE